VRIAIFAINLGSGGAEKVISLLLTKLNEDYETHLVLMNNEIHFSIPDGVKVCILKNQKHSLFNKVFGFFAFIFEYISFISTNKIEISVSFLTRPNLINGLLKLFKPNVKIIISERCFPSIAYKSHPLRYRLYKVLFPLLYNRADLLFSNSFHINTDLKENFNIKIPMEVVYNPVEIIATELERTISKETFEIVYVGKLNSIKNPILLMNTIRLIENRNIKFTFVGGGVLLDEFKRAKEINRLENVAFVGVVKNVDFYLKKASAFVLTSNSEGFPNVILEAMSFGLPIISTNCFSGPLEILNDNVNVVIPVGDFFIAKYGLLINVGDQLGLKKAIDELYSNIKLREELVGKSYTRVKSYSLNTIYTQFSKLL